MTHFPLAQDNVPKCLDSLVMGTGEEPEKNKRGEILLKPQITGVLCPAQPTPNGKKRMSEEGQRLLHDLLAFHVTERGEYLFYRA